MLLEAMMAGAVMLLLSTLLAGVLITVSQVSAAATAVTRGRLLAQSHLEQLRVSGQPLELRAEGLLSTAVYLEAQGQILWRVEVSGPSLPHTLKMVGGP